MDFPPGVAFFAVTDDDSPSVFAAAAFESSLRDMLWRSSPCLADGCDHDWRLLPVIEFRMTVVCRHCGGFNRDLSLDLAEHPGRFAVRGDGSIAQNLGIRRRDPAEAARLIREGYREHGIPDWLAEAMIEETLNP